MTQPQPISAATASAATTILSVQRQHAEQQFAEELAALAEADTRQRPPNWKLSPWAVRAYLLGATLPNGFVVTPKYIGAARLIEIAVATLATDRALLLYGLPGTAKSWVSEHLAAAISGDSTLLVQGTAGTDEATVRYGWNYARLLVEGPSPDALVASPVLRAMREGKLARIEELTRMPAEVQDTFITMLSEKTLPIPELNTEAQARKGFNLIATANNRDKGVNELSSALLRRFNAEESSLTPLSRLLAVAMMLKPRTAWTAVLSSGIGIIFSERTVMSVSWTSLPIRVSSSKRQILPASIARISGVATSASRLGPWASSCA